jgi:hypothetical protein
LEKHLKEFSNSFQYDPATGLAEEFHTEKEPEKSQGPANVGPLDYEQQGRIHLSDTFVTP